MKKSILLTTSLLLVAASASGAAAFAESGQTALPDNYDTAMQFTALADFAIDGDEYAFADGNYLKTYKSGNVGGADSEFSYKITNVEYVGGDLLLRDSSGASYRYADGAVTEYSGTFSSSAAAELTVGNYHYYFNGDGLNVLNQTDSSTFLFGTGYTQLKQYDGRVYAIKENKLYLFDGATESEVQLLYDDYASASEILIGETADLLKAGGAVRFVTVTGGAYITEVDLNDMSGPYFSVGETTKASDGMRAYLLCTSGNASVISVGEKCYITLTANTAEAVYSPAKAEIADGYLTLSASAYSSPYMSSSTAAFPLDAGTRVKVTGFVSDDVLNTDYYQVEYDGKTGYVAKSFVTEYVFTPNENAETIRENISDGTAIRTVVIVLLIILLVFIIIGYLVFEGTRNGQSAPKKNKRN